MPNSPSLSPSRSPSMSPSASPSASPSLEAPGEGNVFQSVFSSVFGNAVDSGPTANYWNNGGHTITNPTTNDTYEHFRAFEECRLQSAAIFCKGGTSVQFNLQKCNSTETDCVDISDVITATAGTEANITLNGVMVYQALTAGDKILGVYTAVNGVVTFCTVHLGGTIP